MKKPRFYTITPAKGQALLNFQGRRFPDKIEVFETAVIEEVNNIKPSLYDKENEFNADFKNLLIQGDCLSACAYLKSENIKIDLVYIDPPFASGANYAKKIYLRNGGKADIEADDSSIGEEVMYGDIWQKEDFLNWLYERLLAIREVMSETASIYVHLDWHIGHYVKILMDEVFGENNFQAEIIWKRMTPSGFKGKFNIGKSHDVIFWYSKSEENIYNPIIIPYSQDYIEQRFNKIDKNGKRFKDEKIGSATPDSTIERLKSEDKIYITGNGKLRIKHYLEDAEGIALDDVWSDIYAVNSQAEERIDYTTQKPEVLLERIIKASSDENMIIADFFSGSGTTAKVANDLNRKFIACDIGINAIQTTRDRLVKAEASFDILKINDGLRLFRNPTQTTAKIFSLIEGFKSRVELGLNEFWEGGIAQSNGSYIPIKFSGIHDKLSKELLDVYLEEIYKLEETGSNTSEVIIIYAHKDLYINQHTVNTELNKTAKTQLKVKLVSLDSLLAEKRDALFTPDNATITVKPHGNKYKLEIVKFYSPYLKNKLDDYNAKKTKKGTLEQDLYKAVNISETGLELIESVQFDTTLDTVWKSNFSLEDKAGIKEKIKGVYYLETDKFKLKIRNIAGDEIIIEP
jgi:adenine-specific DNA-methyltransferase